MLLNHGRHGRGRFIVIGLNRPLPAVRVAGQPTPNVWIACAREHHPKHAQHEQHAHESGKLPTIQELLRRWSAKAAHGREAWFSNRSLARRRKKTGSIFDVRADG
jgi:hypothetical protein